MLLQIESVQERKFVAIFLCGLILLFMLMVILLIPAGLSSPDPIEITFQNRTVKKIKSRVYYHLRKKKSYEIKLRYFPFQLNSANSAERSKIALKKLYVKVRLSRQKSFVKHKI